jgi:PAS domain S-box-containing protein
VLRENSHLLAEQARRESEERFRALAANSSDAVVLVDREGVVTDATPQVGRVLGVDGSQLVGRPISRLVHADDAERIQAFIADVAAGRSVTQPVEWPWGSETQIRSRRGGVVLVDEPAEQVPPANIAWADQDRDGERGFSQR